MTTAADTCDCFYCGADTREYFANAAQKNRNCFDSRAKEIGIVALEIHFPNAFVDHAKLEAYDGVPAGKYTVGLGQKKLAAVCEAEDVNSFALTVVDRLLTRYAVPHAAIGRVEVGTESAVDKAKSVKSTLMQLFAEHGVTDVCGVDNVNACFGGTAALFNAVCWMESGDWDGRLALVVAADIAVYAAGPARPSGGAGAVAVLIGPNAPLVVERGVAAFHFENVYDFFKPRMTSEYPEVDGKLSVECYIRALTRCYVAYCGKLLSIVENAQNQSKMLLSSVNAANCFEDCNKEKVLDAERVPRFVDFFIFHSPFSKMARKAFARVCLLHEAIASGTLDVRKAEAAQLDAVPWPKHVESALIAANSAAFEARCEAATLCSAEIGNMYCASLYAALVAFVSEQGRSDASSHAEAAISGRRIGLFSYGSGLGSAFFSLRVRCAAGVVSMGQRIDLEARLEARCEISAESYADLMQRRESVYATAAFCPAPPAHFLVPGAFYLEAVDERFRRSYRRHSPMLAESSVKN